MRVAATALLIALFLGGCVRYTPHPWSQGFEFNDQNAEFVSAAKLSRVLAEQEADAIKRLDQQSFLRLTTKEYEVLSQNPIGLEKNEIAYLVRGVSWDRPPLFSIVAMEREKKILYVIQYTHNFEMALPGMHWKMEPHPVIAVVDQKVGEVLTRAVIGGDHMMRIKTYYGEKVWDEWTN